MHAVVTRLSFSPPPREPGDKANVIVSSPCIFQCCTMKNQEGLVDFHDIMDVV